MRTIIVEDETNIRRGLIEFFDWASFGIEIVGEAWNGEEGLKLIEQLKPDLVISDIKMPFLDGLGMIEKGQSIHNFSSIILSGYSEFDYAKQAIRLGVTEYLLKPVDYKELEACLERICESRQVQNLKENYLGTNQKINRVIEFIFENMNKRVLMPDVCELIGVSSTTLNEMLKKQFKMTFNDLYNHIKIEEAVRRMREGDTKIYELSDELGFTDYKYFSTLFKKIVGVSPSKYPSQSESEEK